MAVPPLVLLPPQRAALVDASGKATNEWYLALRRLLENLEQSGVDPAVIAEILARLDELEQTKLGHFQIAGLLSVEVQGTPENGAVLLQLTNDEASPGKQYQYMVDPDNRKGWHLKTPDEYPSSIGVYILDPDGNYVTDENNNFLQSDPLLQVEALPDSTYANIQDVINTMLSPGIITGGEVTALDATNVRVLGGTALIRIADDNVSTLKFCVFDATDFAVPDIQTTHFYALDYNGGDPVVVQATVDAWDRDTEIPLGSAFRLDGALNVTPNPYRTGDVVTNLIQRLDAISPVERDVSVGGLAIGVAGSRNITVSAGRLWARVSDFTVAAKNSATDTFFEAYYQGGTPPLNITGGHTQWRNDSFNNMGTGSLQVMGNNKYANLWLFMSFDGTKYGTAFGTAEYNTVGDAALEGVPPYLTQKFFNQALLLGRFIFQKGAATPSLIDSAFAGQTFTGTAINDHNLLGGLQGGAVGEYYHLTAAQQADVATLSAGGTTAQFWRGDQAYSDTLTGGLNFTLDAPAQMFINAFRYGNDAVPPQLAFNKARGTSSVPAAVQAADQLLEFQARGYTSAGAFSGNVGGFRIVAIDNFTSTTQGTRFILRCANTGSTTVATVLESDASRNILPGADATQTLGSSAQRWSNIHAGGAVLQTGAVSPAQLTANTDNWAVTGITTAAIIRASTDASRNLTGIATPTAGQVVILVNVGTQDLVLVHDATSTAANRFLLPNSANLTLNPNDSARLWYDAVSSRWRALGT